MRPAVLLLALAALPACRGASARPGEQAGVPTEARGRSRNHRVDDVTLHTVEVGPERGPLRIVVHGGPGLDHTYLRPWLDPLGQRARLVYVDLRGHGRSSAPADAHGYTLAAAASDLAALIASLGEGAPADVLGHAFGATVVMELAALHPERVRRVVLVDPLRDLEQIRTMPARSRATLGEAGWQRVLDLSTPQGTLRDPHDVTELFRRLGGMWWHRPPADAVLARMGRDLRYRAEADEHFLVALGSWDGRARAAEVRAPALVVSGADDRTFPPADSRALAEVMPHGRYAEVAEAGHCPFIEQPGRFVQVVEAFLRGEGARE
jgi:proline iminopeptidase